MADVNDNRFELHEIQTAGRFGDVVANLNSNFSLIIEAILKKRDGKSAYELWGEQPGNEGKTLNEFFASLKESGFASKAVLSLPTGSEISENTIYAVPEKSDDSLQSPDRWAEYIYQDNSWILMSSHPGSGLSGIITDILNLQSDKERLLEEILCNRLKIGFVFSDANIVHGEYYGTSTGIIATGSGVYDRTPLLKIDGDFFLWGGVSKLSSGYWFDASRQPLSSFSGATISPVIVPSGAAYLGLNFKLTDYPDNDYTGGYIITDSILRNIINRVEHDLKEEVDAIKEKNGFFSLSKSDNLLNPDATEDGLVTDSGDVSVGGVGGSYVTTDYIRVDADESYIVVNATAGITTNYRRYALYDINKNKIFYNGSQSNSFNTEGYPNVAYARLSFLKEINLANVSVTKEGNGFDRYESSLQYDDGKSYDDSSELDLMNKSKVSNAIESALASLLEDEHIEYYILPSENLLNQQELQEGKFLDGANKIIDSDNFNTTGYISVVPNNTYKLLTKNNASYVLRSYALYDGNKVALSFQKPSPGLSTITTPDDNVAYIRYSYYSSVGTNVGFFEDSVVAYSDYGDKIDARIKGMSTDYEDKGDTSLATKQDIETAIAEYSAPASLPVSVTRNGASLMFSFGDIQMDVSLDKNIGAPYANHNFDFVRIRKGTGTWYNIIDDVAPAHVINTTIGANHGQPCNQATITSHGLTNTAIGTAWAHSNGHEYYVVRIIDENTILFLSGNEGTTESPSFVSMGTGTLVSGSTTLTVSSVASAQLYPSGKNYQKRVLIDGTEEITDNGTYKCRYVDVVETYDIIDPVSVLSNLIARAGTDTEAVLDGDSLLRVRNVYRFMGGGNVIVIATYIPQRDMRINDIMFTQSSLPKKMGASYYVPNSLKISDTYDFRKPKNITWSSGLPTLFFNSSNYADAQNPVNRIVTYASEFGFAVGYVKGYGIGKDLNSFTAATFEIRNDSGKIYPHGVSGSRIGYTLHQNDAYSAVMYRAIIPTASVNGNRMSIYHFRMNDDELVYIDYSGSMIDCVSIDGVLNGEVVDVIESVNTTLLADIYNDGVIIKADYVEGETCFIVLRISRKPG